MRTRHTTKTNQRSLDSELLKQLSSADPGPAWVAFLDAYSGLIMKTARQFEYVHDRTTECYLYVCEKLNDDGFRRLLKYNTSGKSRFRTWLGVVVFNLCVDWHRREFGRATLLPAISALPAFDRLVYRLAFEQELGKEACFQTLLADFPGLTRESVESSIIRIYSLLTPRQRWQVSLRNRRKQLARGNSLHDHVERFPDPGMSPEDQFESRQAHDTLRDAMVSLPAQQRLILRLRFQEGVGLAKLAEMAGLGDTNRAWRHLQAALNALGKRLHKDQLKKIRKI